MKSRLPVLLVSLAVVLLGGLATLSGRPSPDVDWLLYAAHRVIDGARLYVDLVEVNPPLVMWLNLPVVLVARALGVADILVFRAALCVLILGSVALAAAVARRRDWLVPLLLFAELPFAGADFGEREHLMFVLVVPYVFIVALRVRGEAPGRVLATTAGLAAGLGVALKPYFLPLPLLLEGYLAWRGRRRVWRRPEGLAAIAVLLAYGAAVLLFAPEYPALAREFGRLYFNFLRGPVWVTLLLGQGSPLVLFALLAFAALRRHAPADGTWTVLALAIAGAFASALLQAKGWRYHIYPAMGFSLLLLAAMVWQARRPVPAIARLYLAACVAVLATVAASTTYDGLRHVAAVSAGARTEDVDPDLLPLSRALNSLAPGGRVLMLSSNMASGFPLVTSAGLVWTSRLPHLWLLAALYMDQLRGAAPLRYRAPAEMGDAERWLNRTVVEDFERMPPDVVIVLRAGPDRREFGIRRIDYLAYFSRDTAFARLMSGYGYARDVGQYRLYRRGAPRGAEPPAPRAAADPATSAGWEGLRGVNLHPLALPWALLLLLVLGVAYRREGGWSN